MARGVIDRTLKYLHDKRDRIDVIYICSNAAIAAQNVNRLNVVGNHEFALASRLTLLPTRVTSLARNPVNFISFTPGTTFNPSHVTEQRKNGSSYIACYTTRRGWTH